MIELRPARNTSLIDITVYSDDRMEAAKIANAVAEVFQSYRQKQRDMLANYSMPEFEKLKDELKNELSDKTNDAKIVDEKITSTIARAAQVYQASIPPEAIGSVDIIELAEPGFRPVRPNKPLNIALGIVIGGFLGVLVAGTVVLMRVLARRAIVAVPPVKSSP
jgi:capsular polysaccharide biosynthesis protein